MSEPKRYALRLPDISYGTEESVNGEYVRYEDYARLKAQAEILTNAGNSIIPILCKYVPRTGAKYALMEWKAAKEGKQS
jgi:hypothetical protein